MSIYNDFEERMSLADPDKNRILKYVIPGNIVDLGTGFGNIVNLVKKRFPKSNILGVDINSTRLEVAKRKNPNVTFIHKNILDLYDIPDLHRKFDTAIISSVLHEIDWPYGRETSEKLFSIIHSLLKIDGVLILRDGVKPENKDEEVEIIIKTSYSQHKFKRFVKEYKPRTIKFSYLDDSHTRVRLLVYDLHDVLCKYYFEGKLWERDIYEVFGSMSQSEYNALIDQQFQILHSKTYIAPYLDILWKRDFCMTKGSFPASHILIVARKSKGGRG